MVHKNPEIAPGLNRFSRARTMHRTGRWAVKNKVKVEKSIKKAKDVKPAKFYPAEDTRRPIVPHKTHRPQRLRQSITPGTVLIVLSGVYKGKRVVFLKQLASGLLLVTGPFKINGVPLRRMNQAYVIATATKVDVSKLSGIDSINEDLFVKPKEVEKKKSEDELFKEEKKEKKSIDESRKKLQNDVDGPLLKEIEAVPYLKKYLNAKFSLKAHDLPHRMQF